MKACVLQLIFCVGNVYKSVNRSQLYQLYEQRLLQCNPETCKWSEFRWSLLCSGLLWLLTWFSRKLSIKTISTSQSRVRAGIRKMKHKHNKLCHCTMSDLINSTTFIFYHFSVQYCCVSTQLTPFYFYCYGREKLMITKNILKSYVLVGSRAAVK